jgi:phosphate transport system permease protein
MTTDGSTSGVDELLGDAEDLRWRYWKGRIGRALAAMSLVLTGAFLVFFLYDVVASGWHVIDLGFLTSDVSSRAAGSGVFNAAVGTIYLMLVTLAFAVPVGIAAAIYLEEFAEDTPKRRALQRLIENLAGVPSIVFGLLGLSLFVRTMNFGPSVLAGGLTLGLLVLPIVVVAAEEALAAVPDKFRDAARAMGATDWQVVRDHVLPSALPGILTGTILALSRAIGETAPILFMASIAMDGTPTALLDGFLALPMQIFHWTTFPDEAFHELAAGAILVLLAILIVMNSIAVIIRQWSLSRRQW